MRSAFSTICSGVSFVSGAVVDDACVDKLQATVCIKKAISRYCDAAVGRPLRWEFDIVVTSNCFDYVVWMLSEQVTTILSISGYLSGTCQVLKYVCGK